MFLQHRNRSSWEDDYLGMEGSRGLDSSLCYDHIPPAAMASTGRLLFGTHVDSCAFYLLLLVAVGCYQTNGLGTDR